MNIFQKKIQSQREISAIIKFKNHKLITYFKVKTNGRKNKRSEKTCAIKILNEATTYMFFFIFTRKCSQSLTSQSHINLNAKFITNTTLMMLYFTNVLIFFNRKQVRMMKSIRTLLNLY